MSGITRRELVGGVGAAALARGAPAQERPLVIGWLTDLSGMMVDFSGMGSVTAATMAIEDYGGHVLGRSVQLIKGDHTNKADVGLAIARTWYDDGVRAIFDIGVTSVALGCRL